MGKNIAKNGKPKSCRQTTCDKKKGGPKIVDDLFQVVDAKTKGMTIELPSDSKVVEFTIKQISNAIRLLSRFDPVARVDAIKRLAVELHKASASVNVAVFSKIKNSESEPDLFEAKESSTELF